MKITFTQLTESHFSLLLKWLEVEHVKTWWDPDVNWTNELISKKYADYVKGYKLVHGTPKPIHPYIICVDEKPIGYTQLYTAYDFPRSKSLQGLPQCLAAFDVLIGETDELGKTREHKQSVLDQRCVDAFHKIDIDPNQYLMIVENDYEIIGMCHLTTMPSLTFTGQTRMQIEAVRVSEQYRGQKIGEWMMNAAINYGKSKGASINNQ